MAVKKFKQLEEQSRNLPFYLLLSANDIDQFTAWAGRSHRNFGEPVYLWFEILERIPWSGIPSRHRAKGEGDAQSVGQERRPHPEETEEVPREDSRFERPDDSSPREEPRG